MTIGELAAAAGDITHRTIRYYEELGLIEPAFITAGGQKRYGTDARIALMRVKILQDAGLQLNDIVELLNYLDALETKNRRKTLACMDIIDDARWKIVQRINELNALVKTLDRALKSEPECRSCTSPDCAGCERLNYWIQFGVNIVSK